MKLLAKKKIQHTIKLFTSTTSTTNISLPRIRSRSILPEENLELHDRREVDEHRVMAEEGTRENEAKLTGRQVRATIIIM